MEVGEYTAEGNPAGEGSLAAVDSPVEADSPAGEGIPVEAEEYTLAVPAVEGYILALAAVACNLEVVAHRAAGRAAGSWAGFRPKVAPESRCPGVVNWGPSYFPPF